MQTSFDIIILGAGPGGYTAAVRASQRGARVALVEQEQIGGTCLNRGCIPTKNLIETLKILEKIVPFPFLNIKTGKVDFVGLLQRKDLIINNARKGLEVVFKTNDITLFQGKGKITSPHTIDVEGNTLKAENIIIATGSRPQDLAQLKPDGVRILTSEQIFSLKQVPPKILIIGGGVIGCEYAQIFSFLGAEVHLVEVLPVILHQLDEEITKTLTQIMTRQGIKIYTGCEVEKIQDNNDKIQCSLTSGQMIEVDQIILSVGRKANIEDIGLENIRITPQEGKIPVNQYLETQCQDVYAVGDIVAGPMLAHKASYDGIVASENITSTTKKEVNYQYIPWAIFTSPEVGAVGLTEEEAGKKYEIKVGRFPFKASGKAQAIQETRGLVKVIVEANSQKILGGHIVGPKATELIGQVTLAMSNNLKAGDFAKVVYAHPTMGECLKEAFDDIEGLAINIPKKRS